MLKRLTIEQFVIIDKLAIDFKLGLTVLTGETGAGKSILLDAMGLILGDPDSPDSIRQGSDKSIIEASFASPADSPVWKFLTDNGLASPSQKEFSIRRVMERERAGSILLNDRAVGLDVLKKAGTFLCEIHGQFANQTLLDPSNQLTLLDLSGNFPAEVYKNVADALHNVHRYKQEQEDENTFFNSNIRLVNAMQDMVTRFEKLGLNQYSVEEIKTEYHRLLTAYEASEAFQGITAHLVASNGAIKSLSAASMALECQKNLDAEEMKDLTGFLAAALQGARSAYTETLRLAPKYDIDTKPLYLYKERMQTLEKISKEIKIPFDGLYQHYQTLAGKLSRVRNSRERIAQLGDLIKKSEDSYRRHAHTLTEHRIIAGKALSEAINAGLPPLKLMRAAFEVQVAEDPKNPWTERGFNTVTFTARMNPGMPFSPIAETASGGELARLILALKVVLQGVVAIPTLVFDEIDTGIGGSAAAAVGERIAYLAETTQVLTITHSPQVAARGDQHLYVSKKTEGDITTSVIATLSHDQRVDEISRMLAGDKITAESHAAANKLIEEASAAAEQRRQKLKKA